MDPEQFRTPQKLLENCQSPSMKYFENASLRLTPQAKFMRMGTPDSITRRVKASFNLFPMNKTPPTRFPKVINPFEAALTDRLHLPLICSPSLFQRPATPQHSSTQFEWTIEEVSSLGPANVEPHETQFQATPDPDVEAKAQAAISTYFKEHLIVPSPVECSLRNQKIVLSLNDKSPSIKSGRRIRDSASQTILTFPSKLPAEIEAILGKYLTYNIDQQQSPTADSDNTPPIDIIDYDARDASMRRKLFDTSFNTTADADSDINNLLENGEISPPPTTPEFEQHPTTSRNFECGIDRNRFHLSPSLSPVLKNSFGSLSPISKLTCSQDLGTSLCRTISNCTTSSNIPLPSKNYTIENFQSTQYSSHKKIAQEEHNTEPNDSIKSTPSRTISQTVNSSTEKMSIDRSFMVRVKQSTGYSLKDLDTIQNLFNKSKTLNDTQPIDETSFNDDYDDDMQMSQISAKSNSSSGSSQHPDTPMRRRRSANRKNLSQSFSYNFSDDDDHEDDVNDEDDDINNESSKRIKITVEDDVRVKSDFNKLKVKLEVEERAVFYRTDSGFNDMTTTTVQDDSKLTQEFEKNCQELAKDTIKTILDDRNHLVSHTIQYNETDVSMSGGDVSMICCSTPSKRLYNF